MHNKIKICYIISNIDKAVAFEWIEENINKNLFEISFILMIDRESCFLADYLKEKNIQVHILSIKKKYNYISALFNVIKILSTIKPDVVHCHLRIASIIGLSAAKLLSIKKRIYTRHHSTFHYDYYPHAVKWDKYNNVLATDIIAISQCVKDVLIKKELVDKSKVHLIHHGFDLKKFADVPLENIEKLKKKYLPPNFEGKVIGVVGRYIHLKGHKYIIDAAKMYLNINGNCFFIFANAKGPDEVEIKKMLIDNLPTSKYIEIKFENDLYTLYKLFDIYIHTPINAEIEAFGQTYVESLASGIPSIFTLSGVAKEFIVHEKNALVVPFKNSESIYEAMLWLTKNEELTQNISKNGPETVKQFELKKFIHKLEGLYQN